MSRLKTERATRGLSGAAIKRIALAAMTLDHIGYFGAAAPALRGAAAPLRILGRIAAPLFLFMLLSGLDHTRSRTRYVLRLYLAGAAEGLLCVLVNLAAQRRGAWLPSGTMFQTLFYTALICALADASVRAAREGRAGRACGLAAALALSFVPTAWDLLAGAGRAACPWDLPGCAGQAVQSVLPSMMRADYGPVFVLLGAAMFFARQTPRRIVVFTCFAAGCAVCWALAPGLAERPTVLTQFFHPLQLCMILAVPVMLQYNGARGRGSKWGYYFYYPLHRLALWLLFRWI